MNTLMIREKNINKVLNAFFNTEILTQNEIAMDVQLSVPSVGKILKGLLEYELITEIEIGESSGGRKPKRYTLSEKKWSTGIIYIEKHVVTLFIFSPYYKELLKLSYRQQIVGNESFEKIIRNILEEAKDKSDFFEEILSWGMIVPGIVDLESNTIIYSNPLGIENYCINQIFKNQNENLSIYLFRDADINLLSNMFGMNYKSEDRIAHIYVNDGVGFSMIKDNQLLKNTVGSLELGHTVYYNSSSGEFVRLGDVFNKNKMSSYLKKGEPEIRELTLRDLQQNGSSEGKELLNIQIESLRILMINVLNMFNPSKLFISGKYINHYNLEGLLKSIESAVLEPFYSNVVIKHAESDVINELRGVVRYINQKNLD